MTTNLTSEPEFFHASEKTSGILTPNTKFFLTYRQKMSELNLPGKSIFNIKNDIQLPPSERMKRMTTNNNEAGRSKSETKSKIITRTNYESANDSRAAKLSLMRVNLDLLKAKKRRAKGKEEINILKLLQLKQTEKSIQNNIEENDSPVLNTLEKEFNLKKQIESCASPKFTKGSLAKSDFQLDPLPSSSPRHLRSSYTKVYISGLEGVSRSISPSKHLENSLTGSPASEYPATIYERITLSKVKKRYHRRENTMEESKLSYGVTSSENIVSSKLYNKAMSKINLDITKKGSLDKSKRPIESQGSFSHRGGDYEVDNTYLYLKKNYQAQKNQVRSGGGKSLLKSESMFSNESSQGPSPMLRSFSPLKNRSKHQSTLNLSKKPSVNGEGNMRMNSISRLNLNLSQKNIL